MIIIAGTVGTKISGSVRVAPTGGCQWRGLYFLPVLSWLLHNWISVGHLLTRMGNCGSPLTEPEVEILIAVLVAEVRAPAMWRLVKGRE